MPDLTRLSKFLSLLLRHQADQFGLELDAQGFVAVDAVWKQVTKRYPGSFQYSDLLQVVDGDATGKKRFELVDGRIRALYGHSAVRAITYEPVEPPPLLYHGTSAHALTAIRADGLQRQARQYVHLTTRFDRATQVGSRHGGQTIILTVRAADAYQSGVQFYHPETDHYLAEDIPAAFIDFPE